MKVLVIWQTIPESITLYLLDTDVDTAEKLRGWNNQFVGSVDISDQDSEEISEFFTEEGLASHGGKEISIPHENGSYDLLVTTGMLM